ncbi:p-loop containing nucleoside triphosphate hydrolase protein [Moesziomyces antarcticus]|uniref:Related to TIF2 - translation initiation factor eIF4A n=2 Tax=Pseudozyma antarctica TaxID=84753 RepID=A0A5C3FK86_PSEA2|nr:p-loop containing nucleoside triphosphate hydrolase protein [Moesziomyces antarcticus]GAK64190.1 p-loop containing nucleoside triphosphate hydrolase protein [Moesziomyces antarcticus]SPO44586.1 related to TIF2 - translation initiation factor eIF4A [Moesziomyces antarcticus]
MSVSPLIPGNSIWSTNASSAKQERDAQSILGTSAGANKAGIDASGHELSASDRAEVMRAGAHPLPSKPVGPARSNSAVSVKSADEGARSADSAIVNAAAKPGVIGGARTAATTGSLRGAKHVDVSRSNSLAASVQSFRTANSSSPLPMQSRDYPNNALHPQQRGLNPLQSPSIQDNGNAHLHDSGRHTGSESEFGTPRLFVDAQHAFDPASASFSRSPSTSSHVGSGFNLGRPRPNSWMHPASHDKSFESNRAFTRDAADAQSSRPASSHGDRRDRLPNQTDDMDPAFVSAVAGKRSVSATYGAAPFNAPNPSANDSLTAASLPNAGGRSSRSDRHAGPGRATPNLVVPNYMNLSGGLLSPTAATIGSAGASGVHSPIGSPLSGSGFPSPSPNRSVSVGNIFDRHSAPADDALAESPLIKEMLERLTRVESGMKDFSRQISGISRNVSLLLERTKALPPASLSGSGGSAAHGGAPAVANSSDEVRALNAQVSALANSVAHLLTLQGGGIGGANIGRAPTPTGLGLGPASGLLGTPQMGAPGGMERATSPRIGANGGGQFGMGPNGSFPQSGALSPRPGGNGRNWNAPNSRNGQDPGPDRRWNQAKPPANSRKEQSGVSTLGVTSAPGLDDGTSANGTLQTGTGHVQPNAIVSKWEHLNLHPDLLRSILKYGLGPPNKIQQRALPFLLRGSDIIAQAPPTQERIASYVIPSLQLVLNVLNETGGPGQTASNRGPVALIVSTTVDQATQAQRMALGLGAPLGIRVHMVAANSIDVHQEAQYLIQAWPHLVVGTPQKMSELFTYMTSNASSLNVHGSGPAASAMRPSEVRLVVLDEVDQLIARNLADHVSTMLRVLPLPSAPAGLVGDARMAGALSPGLPQGAPNGASSPFEQATDSFGGSASGPSTMDRQVALFSNTVPQDVLNFAQSIHLRESVRVLVRRDGAGGAGSSILQAPSSGSNVNAQSNLGSGMQAPGPQRDVSQPSNALGAHPVNSSMSASKDPLLAALKGLRQYYLYVAVTSNGGGMGATSPIPGLTHNPAGEMKLDLISDLLEDIDFGQTVIYCANIAIQEALIYKLSSKGIEALGLNREMNTYTRQQTLAKFRSPSSQFGTHTMIGSATFAQPGGFVGVAAGSRTRKALVVCDLAVNPKEVHQIPLILFYDMPRSVEEYKEKISCAAAGSLARPSVCVNVVTASGGPRGDVEMLRTLECHLGCKMAELPMDSKQILNF